MADPTTVLFPQTRRRLVSWLFMHPEERFYVRQLVKVVGGSLGDVPRELTRLAAAGVVRRTIKGRNVYFAANPDCAIFEELRSMFAKTAFCSRSRD